MTVAWFCFCPPYTWILQCQCWWSSFSRELGELSNRLLCFPALALISLESAERPNYVLCVHDDDTLSLKLWEANSAFHRRATFFHHQDLWIPGYSAFELYSKKGFFIIFWCFGTRICQYDDLYGKRRFSNVIKIMDLKRDYHGSSRWAQSYHTTLKVENFSCYSQGDTAEIREI